MNEFIQKWTIEDLVIHYGLTENDAEIIRQIKGVNRLPYAILYKWFQVNKSFPENKELIDTAIIEFLRQELKENQQTFNNYKWDTRTYRWHCEDIRTRFGYRNLTPEDIRDFRNYLKLEVLPEYDNNDVIYEMGVRRLRTLKLIPPTPGALMRIIASEAINYQLHFFAKIDNLLSSSLKKEIDSFVDKKDDTKIGLTDIRSNPKAIGLNSVYN